LAALPMGPGGLLIGLGLLSIHVRPSRGRSMSQFDDRERAEEKKFELDQELEFKAQARRAKLVGLWVAGLMGLSDAAAQDYAKSVVMADLEEAGVEDLFRKIRSDLDQHAVKLSDHQIRAKMDEALATARAEVKAGR
jgi:hypothetical protein